VGYIISFIIIASVAIKIKSYMEKEALDEEKRGGANPSIQHAD
jgi:hypothetical protein